MTVVQFPLLPIDSQRGRYLDYWYQAALALEDLPADYVTDSWASDPGLARGEAYAAYYSRSGAAYFSWEDLPVRAWWHNDLHSEYDPYEYEARHLHGQWRLVVEKSRGCSHQQFEDAMDALDKFILEWHGPDPALGRPAARPRNRPFTSPAKPSCT